MISLIVPAHNEGRVIGRLLSALLAEAVPGELEVIVVANGCTDDTEAVGASFGDAVTVVSTPIPSKYQALRLGDQHSHGFPRIYVDADVIIRTKDVRLLATALTEPGILAVAPGRTIARAGRPWLVRWYYDVWERLPGVGQELYGRGVIGVSEAGQERLMGIPNIMGDDLAAAIAYAPEERRIATEANVVVNAPGTTSDLIRRRVRSLTATAQLRLRAPGAIDAVRTSRSDLIGLIRRDPALAPKLVTFVGITMWARLRARKPIREQDFTTWLRDESSRAA